MRVAKARSPNSSLHRSNGFTLFPKASTLPRRPLSCTWQEPPLSDSSERRRCDRGETIVVGSASGAVGTAIVRLAAVMGARVIAGASTGDEHWVSDCGADLVIDKHAPDYYMQVERAAPRGVDVWWDASGDDDFEKSVPLLAHGARVIVMAGMQSSPRVPINQLYTRDASVLGFAISNASAADLAEAAKVINQMLATGRLKGRVGATFHLAEAADAHRALEAGGVYGRLLIVP